jgi:hypothetical protein
VVFIVNSLMTLSNLILIVVDLFPVAFAVSLLPSMPAGPIKSGAVKIKN